MLPMDIEAEYNRRIDAMTPTERLQRAAGMLDWARRIVASQVIQELGDLDPERLKLEVARRMYSESEQVRGWIEARLDRV
ncbi:hypothetical protein MalM25_33540 [Planctomycetes bacterium MalM25]|nr:hypothetical protein MalM25_33540 [Planctomycetes bacterium MalM25]